MVANKVIIKYLDGRVVKGTTLDFAPMRETFHLDVIETNERDGRLGMREVNISQLKAIFFVKDFVGRPDYKEREEFIPGDEKRGKRIIIEFQDGERLSVLTMTRADRTKKGFLVTPVDPESNNIRIYIVSAAVKEIRDVSIEERRKDKGLAINKVVVKFLDGRILKGSTLDFDPFGDGFHLDVIQTSEEGGKLGMQGIPFSQLKAVFFVKDFVGRPDYKERNEFLPDDPRPGKRLIIEFRDQEKLSAISMGFGRSRKGFFVNPVDPESNNIRIFVIWKAVKHIEEVLSKTKGDGLAFNKAIVKCIDGPMLKGSILDFDPTADFFHLDVIQTNEEDGKLGIREIDMGRLKAIFFVKDFMGRPDYKEREEFLPGDEKRGKKIVIEFQDGEKLNALSMAFDRERSGFFVNPVDPESNNIRIFVISATVKDVKVIP